MHTLLSASNMHWRIALGVHHKLVHRYVFTYIHQGCVHASSAHRQSVNTCTGPTTVMHGQQCAIPSSACMSSIAGGIHTLDVYQVVMCLHMFDIDQIPLVNWTVPQRTGDSRPNPLVCKLAAGREQYICTAVRLCGRSAACVTEGTDLPDGTILADCTALDIAAARQLGVGSEWLVGSGACMCWSACGVLGTRDLRAAVDRVTCSWVCSLDPALAFVPATCTGLSYETNAD